MTLNTAGRSNDEVDAAAALTEPAPRVSIGTAAGRSCRRHNPAGDCGCPPHQCAEALGEVSGK